MKCFVALDEATLLRLWMSNPELVQPFSRPFYPVRRRQPAANDSGLLKAISAKALGDQLTGEKTAE